MITAVLGVGAFAFGLVVRRPLSDRGAFAVSVSGQVFDTAVVSAFVIAYSFERGTLVPETLFFPLIAGCVRFALVGGLITAAASAPVMVVFEKLHSDHFNQDFRWDYVTLHVGLEALIALIVGRLVLRLAEESRDASTRAEEAVKLRDELARRADVLDAANRCARALSSSLELREAFGAFIRELRGLVPFDRVAIVLAEDGLAQVMASAGIGSDVVFPTGSRAPLEGTLLEDVLVASGPVYRPQLEAGRYTEEREFIEVGLGSRLAAPGPSRQGCSRCCAGSRTRSRPRRSSWWGSSAGSSRRRRRTSAPTRPNGGRSTSCGASRRCVPTSSRSSRTSCAHRWHR
jgi:uncharacterized integral membrane protein